MVLTCFFLSVYDILLHLDLFIKVRLLQLFKFADSLNFCFMASQGLAHCELVLVASMFIMAWTDIRDWKWLSPGWNICRAVLDEETRARRRHFIRYLTQFLALCLFFNGVSHFLLCHLLIQHLLLEREKHLLVGFSIESCLILFASNLILSSFFDCVKLLVLLELV